MYTERGSLLTCAAWTKPGYCDSHPCESQYSKKKHRGYTFCLQHATEFDRRGKVILKQRER